MRIVYGFKPSPFVRKVRVVLAEKGIPYTFEPATPLNPYGFGPFSVDPEFMRISPLGKIPAFRDGPLALADSSIICAYIERAHPEPPLFPLDPYEYARALWFEEYGDTALFEVLTAKIAVPKILGPRVFKQPPDDAAIQKAVDHELPPLFDYLEGQIAGDDGIVGSRFSIGDIGLTTHFVGLHHAGFSVDAARWPRLASYVGRVLARPSFQVAMSDEMPRSGASR